jgi:HD-GYP domain-containing protein (c-di-GMP phosphodiesterase class II)/c-di-GMP-binding flagellar brake protein YcgR
MQLGQQPLAKGFKRFDAKLNEIAKDHISIKIRSLFVGEPIRFDVYFPVLKRDETIQWGKLLSNGQVYEEDFNTFLACENIEEIYIRKAEENSYHDYFQANLQEALSSKNGVPERRTLLLYDCAENIVRKVFRERPNSLNVAMGRRFVESFAFHISSDNIGSSALISIFSKDYDTFSHSVQVAVLGMAFCEFLGWSRDEIMDFGLGALFHDVGKIFIEDAILKKSGRLEIWEYEVIKKHPVLGWRKLTTEQLMTTGQLEVVLRHHEAMDGSGYPDGLRGEEVHKYARVARIVDCYDALTTKRPYKDALPSAETFAIMTGEMAETFDLELLDSFKNFLKVESAMKKSARASMVLGNQLFIQPEGEDFRFKSLLVGMDSDEYLILRAPIQSHLQESIYTGRRVIARYMHAGSVYGFKAVVLGHVVHPVRLFFLEHPKNVEVIELRKSPRVDCFFPASLEVAGAAVLGVILDISSGGCRFVAKQAERQDIAGVQVGESVRVSVQLFAGRASESFTGKIRNIKIEEDRMELGVQFVSLDDCTMTALEEFISNILEVVAF